MSANPKAQITMLRAATSVKTTNTAASHSYVHHSRSADIRSRTSSPTQTRRSAPSTRQSTILTSDGNVFVSEPMPMSVRSGGDRYTDSPEREVEGSLSENNEGIDATAQSPDDSEEADPADVLDEVLSNPTVQTLVESKAAFAHVFIYCFAFLLVILWQAEQSELYDENQVKTRKAFLIGAVFISAVVSQTRVQAALAALTLLFVTIVVVIASTDAYVYFNGGLAYIPITISAISMCAVLCAIVKHRGMHAAQEPSESSKVNTAAATFLFKAIVKWSPFTTLKPADEEMFKIGEALLYGSFIVGLFILWLRAIGLRAKGGHTISRALKQCGPLVHDLLDSVIKLLVGKPPTGRQHRGTCVLTFLEVLGGLCMVSGVVVWIFAFNLPHPVQAGSMSVLILCLVGIIIITCAPMTAAREEHHPTSSRSV